MDISKINPNVNSKYNDFLNKLNRFIIRKEISISSLKDFLKVKKRDTVYDYLNGIHIIPTDKYFMLIELMKVKEEFLQ